MGRKQEIRDDDIEHPGSIPSLQARATANSPGCGKLRASSPVSTDLRPYELFVGLRYTRAKRRTHFISFISIVSMAGIALGIAALVTVMSVMNGFEKEVRARLLGAAAHIQVLAGERGMRSLACGR